jgi:hypothetical protein
MNFNLARQAKHFYWKWKKEGGNNRESDSERYQKLSEIRAKEIRGTKEK